MSAEVFVPYEEPNQRANPREDRLQRNWIPAR
jgi:hypothetical protein